MRKKCPYSELFWSAFLSHFAAFGVNTERYSVSLKVQEKWFKFSRTNFDDYWDIHFRTYFLSLLWCSLKQLVVSDHQHLIPQHFLILHAMCFYAMWFREINSNDNLSENMWNVARQPLKTFCYYFHNACCRQTWQGGALSWGTLTHKITWTFDYVILRKSRCKLKTLYLHCQDVYDDQTWHDGKLTSVSLTHEVMRSLNRVIFWESRDKLKVFYNIFYTISTRMQSLWLPILAWWWLTLRSSFPYSHTTFW